MEQPRRQRDQRGEKHGDGPALHLQAARERRAWMQIGGTFVVVHVRSGVKRGRPSRTRPRLLERVRPQLRSARAGRLPLVEVSDEEPIVLLLPELLPPEALGVVADEEPVDGVEAEEPDELVDGVLLEPLAPMEVPLADVPPLALGVLLLELPEALGDELELPEGVADEPEAPMVEPVLGEALGDFSVPPAAPPLVSALLAPLAPLAPPAPLWATATPPNARAAAAASVERVILVARMCLTPR